MTDSPDKRQADLDWLYAGQGNTPATDESAGDRPRIRSAAYDSSDLPPARPRPVSAPPRTEAAPQATEQRAPRPQDRQAPRPRQPRVRRQRRAGRTLRGIVTLLIAVLVWLIAVPLHAVSQMTEVDQSAAGERPARQPGTAVLLVGNDARPDTGHGEEIGQRADTIMLLYRPRSGRSVLVSLPRDSYVSIPGYGPDKLNAA